MERKRKQVNAMKMMRKESKKGNDEIENVYRDNGGHATCVE